MKRKIQFVMQLGNTKVEKGNERPPLIVIEACIQISDKENNRLH